MRLRRRRPLVSLILCTKNAMPYVREAVDSVRHLSYRPFELVVQDACSTDGTAEFLSALDGVDDVSYVSEPDGGIGDGFNRALARCSGEIIGSIDGDNLLEPRALEQAVAAIDRRGAAAAYGAVGMVDADGVPQNQFLPAPFDVHALMRCELVPPFSTAFFSRAGCGDELRFTAALRTCADFDLWLRISDRPIVRVEEQLGRTRLSPKSMSQDAGRYDQFCADKIAALDVFLAARPALASQRQAAHAGVYCWAAESVFALEGASARFVGFVERAAALDQASPRVQRLLELAESAPASEAMPR
jgi:glycosyltransferase involved in cell wall biosynthesis